MDRDEAVAECQLRFFRGKSPSGPIMTIASCPSYLSKASFMEILGCDASSKQYAMSLNGFSVLSLPYFRMKSLTDIGSFIAGTAPLRDCFAADTNIFSTLAVLNIFRSECIPIIGEISSVPISQAFSANHSYLSAFFVGATARCSLYGCVPQSGSEEIISASTHFGDAEMMRHRYSVPVPSITEMMSPSLCLSTFAQCAASSSESLHLLPSISLE